MSDDLNVEQEEDAELTIDQEEAAGFEGLEAGEPEDKTLEDKKPEDADPDGDKPKDDDKPPEDDNKGNVKTAAEIALERAEKLGGEDDDDPTKNKKPDDEKPPDEPKKNRPTKEQISEYLSLITDEDIPDGKVLVGNEEVDLAQYRKEYPEEFANVKVLSSIIAKKMVEKALANAGFAKTEEAQQVLGEMHQEITTLRYFDEVRDIHPDARPTIRSKEFKEWFGAQSDKMKRLYSSPDPEDGIALLSAYKETIASKKVKEKDDADKEKKKGKDNLHKSGLNAIDGGKKKPAGAATDDEEAAFNEGASGKK